MRPTLEIPRLSLAERDRRYAAVRAQMAKRGLDAIVLWGWPLVWDFYVANARYLSPIGGNGEFNVLIFPAEGEPVSIIQLPTFAEGWRAAQNWVGDIRVRNKTWANSVAGVLKEKKLERGKIGMDGLAGPLDPDGWLPHDVHTQLLAALPEAEIGALDDMLEKIRAIKSEEELGMLRKAARVGDLMLATCRDVAKPGVKECEVFGAMMQTMLSNGGEEPTLFLWNSDRYPYPHPFRTPTMRKLDKGDLIICEMHPKFGAYFTHVERTFCLGEPEKEQLKIYEGCLAAYRRGLENFGPGKTISTALMAVKDEIDSLGLGICEAGIHGHGLASLEYPRFRHHAIAADREAIKVIGDRFEPGMVFAFNIDLVDPKWHDGKTGCVFAETIEITADGARRMHSYPMEFQKI